MTSGPAKILRPLNERTIRLWMRLLEASDHCRNKANAVHLGVKWGQWAARNNLWTK